jgi:integrase
VLDRPAYEQLLLAKAEIMIRGAVYADSTREFYRQNWVWFEQWCEDAGRQSLPASAETIVLALTSLLIAPKKLATVRRYLTSIRHKHVQNGFPSPVNSEITALLRGAQRLRCERSTQKRPVTIDLLRRMSAALTGPAVLVSRNRAVLILGFASALRRRSLCRLNVQDVGFDERGLLIEVRNEKQDRRGRGRLLAVARGENPDTCPVEALEKWLALRGRQDGPLFTPAFGRYAFLRRLHPSTIAYVVKRAAKLLGLDPAAFAGHSLRAGMVTSCFENGVAESVIAEATGHRSLSSLRRYFRRSDPFKGIASGLVGL